MIRWCLKRADEKGEIKVRGVRDRRGDRLGLVYLNRSIHSSTIILGLLGMILIEEEWRKLVRLVGGMAAPGYSGPSVPLFGRARASLTGRTQKRLDLRIRLDFCRKARIPAGVADGLGHPPAH